MEHHLDRVSLGAISTKDLNYAIYSNSDHMTINALTQTDLCSLGINFMHQPYKNYDIKNLKINGCEPFLLIGTVRPEGDDRITPTMRETAWIFQSCPACGLSERCGTTFPWSIIWTGSHWGPSVPKT